MLRTKLTRTENSNARAPGVTYFATVLAIFLAFAVVQDASAFHSPSWFGILRPGIALDLNPDPKIVEVVIEAKVDEVRFGGYHSPKADVYTFNGTIPGPMILADVGDTLIVHFHNNLPEESTIHWHGLELPANMDGSNISQVPVPSGGYFRYEFKLLRASTFWYHPHIRTNEQIEKGLYAPLVVTDRQFENHQLDLPWREHVLVLDDVRLDEDGQIAEPFPSEPLANAETQVNGRTGNTFLVNGRTNARGAIRRGVPHRIRFINTSNTRFMRVSIDDFRMFRIGGDGGLLETPIEIPPIGMVPDPDNPGELISDPDLSKGIILTPGERADVVFTPTGHKDRVKIKWHDHPRGRHAVFFKPDGTIGLGDAEDDGKRPPQTLLTLDLYGHHSHDEYIPPSTLRDIEPIDPTGASDILLTFGHTPPNASGDITFFVQTTSGSPIPGMPLPFPALTPADAPVVSPGDTRIFQVHNLTGGDHNFHPHGFVFQLLETQFIDLDTPENNFTVPAPYLEDKDTIRLPKRPGAMGRSRTITRLVMKFDDTDREGQIEAFGKVPGVDTSGGWVAHCHINEHADLGMMTFVQVVEP